MKKALGYMAIIAAILYLRESFLKAKKLPTLKVIDDEE
tara:strand:+ start:47 stop:160 length:114 start_codon:yes stop_codon:yes gene_type:complete